MKDFKDIQFPPGSKYASDRDFKPYEFYAQAIPLSKKIDLKLGYFSTYAISILAVPFSKFILSNGVFRIITCHILNSKDLENVISPLDLNDDDLKEIETIFANTPDKLKDILIEGKELFYNCLNYLQQKNRLVIQPVFFQKEMTLAHEKCAIFYDGINKLSIDGSCNFTPSGLLKNGESFKVTRSWRDDEDAKSIELDEYNIDSIFRGEHKDYILATKEKLVGIIKEKATTSDELAIVEQGEKLFKKIEDFYEKNERGKKIKIFLDNIFQEKINELKLKSSLPFIPDWFLNEENKLREHQEYAISSWFKNNGVGIFHMATGSGKTVTALSTVTRLVQKLVERKGQLGIIVTVPYKHLADQWQDEASNFGFSPIICYGSYKKWINEVNNEIININARISNFFFVITSNATFTRDKFQKILSEINFPFIFIADEMHNLGGRKISTLLPSNARFRIGLSATPDRHLDEEGTQILRDFFGKAVIKYGLQEAIQDGTLCKYNYYPILISFTESELEEYKDISIQIARAFSYAQNDTDTIESERLKKLLIKRSRIVANADNKLVKLRELIEDNKESNYNLIYCGDEIEYTEFGQDQEFVSESESLAVRQVDKILLMVGNDIGMRANKFTAQEDQEKRKRILKQFGEGKLQTLVAIRCLDEGVDVPRTENAYILASSSNPRQFIQRRGRVLRKAEGKKRANIYDFIVIPDDDDYVNSDSFNVERNLLIKELNRVNEFASMSENPGHSLDELRRIKIKYHLLDL